MRSRRILWLGTLLATAACTAIAGLDGDFEQATSDGGASSSGDSNAPKADGSSSGSDSGPSGTDSGPSSNDAGFDAPDTALPDTGPTIDLNPPAEFPYADDAGGRWCKSDAAIQYFCWDFQGAESSPAFGWTTPEEDDGISVPNA